MYNFQQHAYLFVAAVRSSCSSCAGYTPSIFFLQKNLNHWKLFIHFVSKMTGTVETPINAFGVLRRDPATIPQRNLASFRPVTMRHCYTFCLTNTHFFNKYNKYIFCFFQACGTASFLYFVFNIYTLCLKHIHFVFSRPVAMLHCGPHPWRIPICQVALVIVTILSNGANTTIFRRTR
jgi:hypothetical protein